MRLRHVTLLPALLLLTSCLDLAGLAVLRSGLTEEFHTSDIGVSLTDGLILTVTFINAPVAREPCLNQAALAMRVAGYVRNHYRGFDSLHVVSVAFEQRGPLGRRDTRGARLPFRFGRAALETGLTAADTAGTVALCDLDLPVSSPGLP